MHDKRNNTACMCACMKVTQAWHLCNCHVCITSKKRDVVSAVCRHKATQLSKVQLWHMRLTSAAAISNIRVGSFRFSQNSVKKAFWGTSLNLLAPKCFCLLCADRFAAP